MSEILTIINQGSELEMPRGVANRLTEAGFTHPDGQPAMERVLVEVMMQDNDGNTNFVAAQRLAAAGVTR